MSNRTSLASISSFKSNLGSPMGRQSSRTGIRSLQNERNSHFEELEDNLYFVELPQDTLKCKLCEAVFRTEMSHKIIFLSR